MLPPQAEPIANCMKPSLERAVESLIQERDAARKIVRQLLSAGMIINVAGLREKLIAENPWIKEQVA